VTDEQAWVVIGVLVAVFVETAAERWTVLRQMQRDMVDIRAEITEIKVTLARIDERLSHVERGAP
jgi:hypothetical protein